MPTTIVGENSQASMDVAKACLMLDAGLKARVPRFTQIRKNEDMHNGFTTPALKGRNNVPFDCFVMRGFIDTLNANIDDDAVIDYAPKRQQDKMAADKITAAYRIESGPDKGAWNDKIMDAKFLASLSGRGFLKLSAGNIPSFYTNLEVCDHYDMVTEVRGGGHLDKHLYKFQMNIFRTKQDLIDGVGAGIYDKTQVKLLIGRYANTDFSKKSEEIAGMKADRWANLGIEGSTDSYVGQGLYRLTEGVVNLNGKWWYLVFSKETSTWIRREPLESVFEYAKYFPGRGPWYSFSTHRHPFMFWNQAPADDIRPIGYTMKKIVNLTLDNLEKRNWDMTAYDPKIFTDPSQLLYRQDGLVRATLRPDQDISRGIFKFQTPDTTSITINMVEWLNNFIGQKTGITPDAQGASDAQQVGILTQNLAQTSKRLTLTNKTIRAVYSELGVGFDYACYEYLREPYAVKLIGPDGVRWEEEITRDDVNAEFTVSPHSQIEEQAMTAEQRAERDAKFTAITTNPMLLSLFNKNWLMRESLRKEGYKDDQIRIALDPLSDGDEEVMAKAAKAIQDCLEGVPYLELYRGATAGFIQKIISFAADKFPLIPAPVLQTMKGSQVKRYKAQMVKFDKLVAYAKAHVPIATYNMQRKFVTKVITDGMNQPAQPEAQTPSATPPAGAPAPSVPVNA